MITCIVRVAPKNYVVVIPTVLPLPSSGKCLALQLLNAHQPAANFLRLLFWAIFKQFVVENCRLLWCKNDANKSGETEPKQCRGGEWQSLVLILCGIITKGDYFHCSQFQKVSHSGVNQRPTANTYCTVKMVQGSQVSFTDRLPGQNVTPPAILRLWKIIIFTTQQTNKMNSNILPSLRAFMLVVGLSAGHLKTTDQISMKLWWRMGLGPE